MVNEVVDLTLTKLQLRRGIFKRLRKLWLVLAIVGLLLGCSLLWPTSPRNLSVSDRLVTSGLLASWRDGDVIVLVRHEERCDRSTNPCLGPPEGVTVNGSQHAQSLGNAFKTLGMQDSDVLASPAVRTDQTAHFMFGKAELTASEQAICGAAMGEELLSRKTPGRNLVFVTHSGCISDFEKTLGYPHAAFTEYGSALFVQVMPNGQFKTLGIMNSQEWSKALKQL